MGSIPVRTMMVLLAATAPSAHFRFASAADDPIWVGTGSCAATACHGGRRDPIDLKGSEYSFWGAYDPHGRAYSVLHEDRSLRIEGKLKNLSNPDLARPFEHDLCLKCHVHQGFDSAKAMERTPAFARADGVGCESCHGAASAYLVPHSEAGWSGLTDRRKFERFGLRPMKDLLERGRVCTDCHVGRGDADVNHDLIAAGHPRLRFEYGSQLAKIPKHWRAGDDRTRNPDQEAKVWALGQILAARASLDLLEARAIRAIPEDSTAPWPEFAESSCFSCHHHLATAPRLRSGDQAGLAPWASWYLSHPAGRTASFLGFDNIAISRLRELMASPAPDPAVVARRARAASEDLGRRAEAINRGRVAPGEIRALLIDSLRDDPEAGPLDWDRAAQRYLAIVALDKASSEGALRPSTPKARLGLGRMLADLDLPIRIEGRDELFDSPRRHDPARIREDLRVVREALAHP